MAAAFDLQAHRGGRGLTPESTLAGFRNAISLGVTTLETDLAVTKDDVLVLSHEPRLNPDLVRGPDGTWLAGIGPTIHSLTLAELKTYDIGRLNPTTKYGQQFPAQKPSDGERFPTLAELYAMAGPGVRSKIETKIDPTRPDETVDPAHFAAPRRRGDPHSEEGEAHDDPVMFDWRTLVEAKKIAPDDREQFRLTIESREMNTVGPKPSPWMAGLDVNPGGSLLQLVKRAGCSAWSPFWRNVTAAGNVIEVYMLSRPQGHSVDRERPGRNEAADRHQGRRVDHRLSRPRDGRA